MSIQSEVERIKANVAATYAAAAGLGAEMPDAQNSNNLSKTVAGAKAVLYAPQELTAEQQAQARVNIGAAGEDDVSQLSLLKADKEFVVSIFEQLKALIEAGKTDEAIAVLDEAILDLAVLA